MHPSRLSGLGLISHLLTRSKQPKQRQLRTQIRAIADGLKEVRPAIEILLLAWVLGAMTSTVGTGAYLEALLGDTIHPGLLPAVTFLLAATIAFSTGTSFGTMGILIPIILPLAAGIGDISLLIICSAAILDGAIFGDHCSPLSDTTILSSLASQCPLDEHVRTQIPYALLAMAVALCVGYLPAGMGWYGPWVATPLGTLVRSEATGSLVSPLKSTHQTITPNRPGRIQRDGGKCRAQWSSSKIVVQTLPN